MKLCASFIDSRNEFAKQWNVTALVSGFFRDTDIWLLLLVSSSGFSNDTDGLFLLDIKGSLAGGGDGLSSWNESTRFCHWLGVVCGEGKIIICTVI